MTLNVPVATVGNSNAFREVAGLVTLTPAAGENNGVALRVPYYLVPRALSNVTTKVDFRTLKASSPSTKANVKNGGPIAGDADFYAWGLQDAKDEGHASNDLRAVGVQSFEWDPTQQLLVFAVNVWDRWSNAASNEFDIAVDVDNDGTVDYFVVGVDIGPLRPVTSTVRWAPSCSARAAQGRACSSGQPLRLTRQRCSLPALTSQLCRPSEPCLSSSNPRITYAAAGFDLIAGGADVMPGEAKYNAWSSSISQGDFATLPPNGSVTVPISINPTEWALTPALGIMVVTLDDRSTQGNEADLVELFLK